MDTPSFMDDMSWNWSMELMALSKLSTTSSNSTMMSSFANFTILIRSFADLFLKLSKSAWERRNLSLYSSHDLVCSSSCCISRSTSATCPSAILSSVILSPAILTSSLPASDFLVLSLPIHYLRGIPGQAAVDKDYPCRSYGYCGLHQRPSYPAVLQPVYHRL